ncbi:MAG: hypothetical protein ACSLE5_05080, partial [Porticoccaceae bacterium]
VRTNGGAPEHSAIGECQHGGAMGAGIQDHLLSQMDGIPVVGAVTPDLGWAFGGLQKSEMKSSASSRLMTPALFWFASEPALRCCCTATRVESATLSRAVPSRPWGVWGYPDPGLQRLDSAKLGRQF